MEAKRVVVVGEFSFPENGGGGEEHHDRSGNFGNQGIIVVLNWILSLFFFSLFQGFRVVRIFDLGEKN